MLLSGNSNFLASVIIKRHGCKRILNVKLIFLSAVAIVALSTTAFAADLPASTYSEAPAMVSPAYSWTGFYVGGDVGGAWTTNTGTFNPQPSVAAANFGINTGGTGGSGVLGGLFAGYNYQFAPQWVAGIEGDWSWTAARGSFTQLMTNAAGTSFAGTFTTMSSKLDWVSSLRGRIGYLVMPNLLAYGTGGVAWGRFDYAASNFCPAGLCAALYSTTAAISQTQTGFVVGGGVEWAFTRNWLARAEYLYYGLSGGPNVTVPAANFPGTPSNYVWTKTNVNVARAGVSYKF
jgi:outer membrane immunogenic protein